MSEFLEFTGPARLIHQSLLQFTSRKVQIEISSNVFTQCMLKQLLVKQLLCPLSLIKKTSFKIRPPNIKEVL